MATNPLLLALFDKIEIRTAIPGAERMLIDLRAPADPATAALMSKVKPMVILSGNAGRFEIAPYGAPTGVSQEFVQAMQETGLGITAAVAGLGVLAFLALRK